MKGEGHICTVRETAEILGLSESYLRKHARELGGVRLTPTGHWRFIPAQVKERLFNPGQETGPDVARDTREFFGCRKRSRRR